MDLGKIWDDLGKQVNAGLSDLEKTAVPAMQSSLEKWGIDVLQKQNKETQNTLNQNVTEIMNRPSTGTGFGDYFRQTMQGPIFKQYGGLMVAGVVGLLFVGMYLRK